jgi:hypothetical protein
MTRHFLCEDPDGKNPRHLTLAEFLDAQERGDPVRLTFIESNVRPRSTVETQAMRDALINAIWDVPRAPASLSEAAQALRDC